MSVLARSVVLFLMVFQASVLWAEQEGNAQESCESDGPKGRPCAAIVLFRDNTDSADQDASVRDSGASLNFKIPRSHAASVSIADRASWLKLNANKQVVALIPDRPVHAVREEVNSDRTNSATKTTASRDISPQIIPAGVARIHAAPGQLPYKGTGIGVAIIDTGIDLTQRDLKVSSTCFSAFSSGCQDGNGHGTHVSGIVAALDNTINTVGVAPLSTLYAVRVLDSSGSGSDSTVMAGLDWVLSHANSVVPAIRVVNMSLGRPGSLNDNPALRTLVQSVRNLGITIVVAAGNDALSEISGQIPAAYPEVLAVASASALDGTNAGCPYYSGLIFADTASYFTTDGAGVALSAPGEERENISSGCSISSVGILSLKRGGGVVRLSGTSMAAPHLAGVAALLLQKNLGTLDPETVRSILSASAFRIGIAPLNSPTSPYSFDGVREGILSACGALGVSCL